MLKTVKSQLKTLLLDKDESHNFEHSCLVMENSIKIINDWTPPSFTPELKEAIQLASLLHDADDKKIFNTHDYYNAKKILSDVNYEHINLVITMIKLVSTSENRNDSEDILKWMLIPRWSDRLEAIGKIGIKRCWLYTKETNRALYTENTPRAKSVDELNKIIVESKKRFANYNGKSSSMMDHYYDKLLHLFDVEVDNEYLISETAKRKQIMIDFVLEFGNKGFMTDEMVQKYI